MLLWRDSTSSTSPSVLSGDPTSSTSPPRDPASTSRPILSRVLSDSDFGDFYSISLTFSLTISFSFSLTI